MDKYLLVDYCEDTGIVGCYATKEEALKAKANYERDCDDECNCEIIERLIDKKIAYFENVIGEFNAKGLKDDLIQCAISMYKISCLFPTEVATNVCKIFADKFSARCAIKSTENGFKECEKLSIAKSAKEYFVNFLSNKFYYAILKALREFRKGYYE